MISVGTPASDFELPDQQGTPFRLSSLRGKKNVLLFFIPAAFTQICGTEVPAMASLVDAFDQGADTTVVVITADRTDTNLHWLRHLGAERLRILSDFWPHGQASQAYGAFLAADGIPDRATVLVGKDGLVKYAESVGKFGKRSASALLQMARAQDGRAPLPADAFTARMPLDLPVLFVTSQQGCPHCRRALEEVRALQLEERIVIRSVDTDPEAMRWLLSVRPEGGVPALYYQGYLAAGDDSIIQTLSSWTTQRAA
jgi:peroxiredoxin